MKQANIAIFVPHAGCRHQCSFCNQRSISGSSRPATPNEVYELCKTALPSARKRFDRVEIAFFGGSFTAIPRGQMVGLLQAAQPFLQQGLADGIRISTRPDAIDPNVLQTLQHYGVCAIELGAQSMNNRVLAQNGRGHTRRDTLRAAALIRATGFSLGVQMMIGLPGEPPQAALRTAKRLAALRPDTARVYPTVVLPGTELEELWRQGQYTPPGLEEGIALCAATLRIFEAAGVRVIRLGLHSAGGQADMLAGCFHPALRELAEGRLLYEDILAALAAQGIPGGAVDIHLPPTALSRLAGHGRRWLAALEQAGFSPRLVQDSSLTGLNFAVEAAEQGCRANLQQGAFHAAKSN